MATETKKGKRAKSTSPEALLKDIRRNTKHVFSSEQKVLIVMEGIRGGGGVYGGGVWRQDGNWGTNHQKKG